MILSNDFKLTQDNGLNYISLNKQIPRWSHFSHNEMYYDITPETSTTSGDGVGYHLRVAVYGGSYVYQGIWNQDSEFQVNDTITVLGSTLGGVDTENDLVITILSVNGSGAITNTSMVEDAINNPILLDSISNRACSITYEINARTNYGNIQKVVHHIVMRSDDYGSVLFRTTKTVDLLLEEEEPLIEVQFELSEDDKLLNTTKNYMVLIKEDIIYFD